jgi:orotidine-5'-phosphate decarboxylase
MSEPANPVFCAIDTDDLSRAEALARAVAGGAGGIKLGKEFFTAHGPEGVRRAQAASGLPLFLDLKWHDIPNTVAGAVRAALPLKPFMLNVHATGGPAMLKAAREAAGGRSLVSRLTVLASLAAA